jgi:hypothetical protein
MRVLKRAAPALAAGITGLTMMSVAAAAPAVAAPAHPALAKGHIHKTRCSVQAFDVYYHKRDGAPACQGYEGTGTTAPDIARVYQISTGENTGHFTAIEAVTADTFFYPHMVITFRSPPGVELVRLTITRT